MYACVYTNQLIYVCQQWKYLSNTMESCWIICRILCALYFLLQSVLVQVTAWNCGYDTYSVFYLQSKKDTAHPEATLHFSLWKVRASKHRSKHNSPSKTSQPFIWFILHLTWERTLMWNCLMIYCGGCLSACRASCSGCMCFILLSRCVSPERALWRPETEYWALTGCL